MHSHAHHTPVGDALRDAAQRVLERAGERWTATRRSVFDALARFDRPASAYDIAEAVSKAEDRRVPANSVYRILDLFVGTNVALRVESANAFLVNAHPECVHDCIFLICDSCGQATHIDDDSLTNSVRSAASRSGFLPIRPVIEVHGKCARCQ